MIIFIFYQVTLPILKSLSQGWLLGYPSLRKDPKKTVAGEMVTRK
jgi:hypothetical protein